VVTLSPDNNFIELNGTKSSDPDGDPLTFDWTLLDGPNTPVIVNADQPVTRVTDLVSGDYKFRLIVKDDKGAADGDTVGIRVIMEEVVKKTCGPLEDIISDFVIWNNKAKKNGPFKEAFGSYEQVVTYFKILDGQVSPAPVEDQIKFFENGFFDLTTPELIMKWLNELQNIIQERQDIRLLALMLYRILNQLCMYIVCIQPEDFDKARVPMSRVFELIRIHVQLWVSFINQGAFTEEEVAVVKSMGEDIGKEIQRVEANGEKAAKAKYLKFIGKILDLISTLP
jgi:hypothetical protein